MRKKRREANEMLASSKQALHESTTAKIEVKRLVSKALRFSEEGDAVRKTNHFSQRIESVYQKNRKLRR